MVNFVARLVAGSLYSANACLLSFYEMLLIDQVEAIALLQVVKVNGPLQCVLHLVSQLITIAFIDHRLPKRSFYCTAGRTHLTAGRPLDALNRRLTLQ